MRHANNSFVNKLERVSTAFNLCIIEDGEIFSGPGVILVYNFSDDEVRKNLLAAGKEMLAADCKSHKPAGWGHPGGVVKSLESPREGALTELAAESGLREKKGVIPEKLLEPHAIPIVDKKTNDMRGRVMFEKGSQPRIFINPRTTSVSCEDSIFLFKTEVEWEGSALQARLRKIKRQLLEPDQEGGGAAEDIEREGVWFFFSEISKEAVDLLGIEEIHEIGGLGLFPVGLFRGDVEGFPVPVYRSHFGYAQKGLKKLGLIAETEADVSL